MVVLGGGSDVAGHRADDRLHLISQGIDALCQMLRRVVSLLAHLFAPLIEVFRILRSVASTAPHDLSRFSRTRGALRDFAKPLGKPPSLILRNLPKAIKHGGCHAAQYGNCLSFDGHQGLSSGMRMQAGTSRVFMRPRERGFRPPVPG